MHTRTFCSLVTVVVQISGVITNIIQLSPTQINVVENSSAILTCSSSESDLIESNWKNSQIGEATVVHLNDKCLATAFLHKNELFAGMCNDDGTYSVVLKRIDRTEHGAEWTCRQIGLSSSNKVIIYVSVPASSVRLIGQNGGYMQENQADKIIYKTSACRPVPRLQWYLRNNQPDGFYNLTQFSTNTYVDREYGLKAVESLLDFKPNRTVNGFHLYCEVWTRSDKADITSRKITLNVTFPPDDYPKIHDFEPNSVLRVFESETGIFLCSVTGGNPLASLSWNCFGSYHEKFETKGDIVTSTVRWTALRNYSSCSCLAHHLNNWKRIANITVNVQFPTEIITFSLSSSSSEQTVVINESDEASLLCIAEANPFSNLSIENPRGDYISEVSNSNFARHNLRNVSYVNAGKYTCTGRNNYTRGSNASSELIIIVRCKPDPPTDFNIIDNSITDSTVTLSWSPSFNGGLQQTFVLIYKIKHETVILNESVMDNGKSTMYYAIYGLFSMQDYEIQIQIFAKNRERTSAHTERLQFKTKAKMNRLKETICSKNTGSSIGVGVGTFFSTLIIVAFLHIGFQRYKKLKFSSIKGKEQAGMDIVQTSVTEGRQVPSVYTDLEGNRKEGNVYDVVKTQTSRTAPDKQISPPRSSAYIEMKDTRG